MCKDGHPTTQGFHAPQKPKGSPQQQQLHNSLYKLQQQQLKQTATTPAQQLIQTATAAQQLIQTATTPARRTTACIQMQQHLHKGQQLVQTAA